MSDLARSYVVFTFTSALSGGESIPVGTIVQSASTGLKFITMEAYTGVAGDTETTIQVEAEGEGSEYSGLAVDDLSVLVTSLSFVDSVANVDITSGSSESINPDELEQPWIYQWFANILKRHIGDLCNVYVAYNMEQYKKLSVWVKITPNGKYEAVPNFDLFERTFEYPQFTAECSYGIKLEIIYNCGLNQQYGNKTFFDVLKKVRTQLPLYVGAFSKLPPRSKMISPFSESIDNPRSLDISTDWTHQYEPYIELVENIEQVHNVDPANPGEDYIAKGWDLNLLTTEIFDNIETFGGIL